jgi:hypothetical protein
MSKWWGVHNDEDEVAYNSDKPKVRYEYKQARCNVSKSHKTSIFAPTKSSTNTKSLLIVKVHSSHGFILRLKKR